MTDQPSSAGLFRDLATDPATKAAVLTDASLAVDEFAAKHGPTIRQHYGKGGYMLDAEEGWQAAARLWQYLRGET
ncbi:MAG: hypothetical protein MUC55_00405 [Burkholderiales bacterium]|nr:hypothetical protein [Burkholderiales bacterium]